jgi:chromosome segregation ATPase
MGDARKELRVAVSEAGGEPWLDVVLGILNDRKRFAQNLEASSRELQETRALNEALETSGKALDEKCRRLETEVARANQASRTLSQQLAVATQAFQKEQQLRCQLQSFSQEKATRQAGELDRLRSLLSAREADLGEKASEVLGLRRAVESSEAQATQLQRELGELRVCFHTARASLEAQWSQRLSELSSEKDHLSVELEETNRKLGESLKSLDVTRSRLESELTKAQHLQVDQACEVALLKETCAELEAKVSDECARSAALADLSRRQDEELQSTKSRLSEALQSLARHLAEAGDLRLELSSERRKSDVLRQELERLVNLEPEVIPIPAEVAKAVESFEESQQLLAAARAEKDELLKTLGSLEAEVEHSRQITQDLKSWAKDLKEVARGLQREAKLGASGSQKMALLAALCEGDQAFFGEESST